MTRTRRDEIVDAALELFAARGYQGASIDAIAQRVGLTRQGVLHYFPGKEKLLVEVLRRREELARAHLRSDYAEEDLPDQMAHVVAHDHERVGLTQVYSVLLGESITEGHPAQGYFRDHYAAVRARMADSFTERWGERLPSGLTPRAAATALLALLDGMQQQWLLAPEQDDHPEIIRDVLTVLLGEDSGARHRADRSAGHGEGRGGGQGGGRGGGQGGEPAEEPVEEQRDEHAARQGRGQGGEPVRERAEENAGRQGGERIRERREEQGGEPVREPRDEPGGRQSAGPVSERREEHRGEHGAEPVREHPDEPGGRQGGHPGRGRFGATSTVPAATSAEEPPPGQPAAGRRRDPSRKGAERREQILRAALEVFAERGTRGTLQEIADRVGVKQPSLMYYFGSREELLLAVLKERDELGAMTARQEPDPVAAVTGSVRRHLDEPGLIKLFAALSAAATNPDNHARDFFAERQRAAQASLTAGLAEGQRRQWVRDDERADDMARLLPAVVDGLQTQWLLDPSVDMPALVETFLRLCTKQRESASDSEQGPAG